MENLYTALSISLITDDKRFVIVSDDSNKAIPKFTSMLVNTCSFDTSQYCVIDLLNVHTTIDLIHQMTNFRDNQYFLKNIIIWQNVQYLTTNQHKSLYKLILQIDQFGLRGVRGKPIDIAIGNDEIISINRPQLFTIIMAFDYKAFSKKLYIYLKEKFWFAVNYNNVEEEDEQESDGLPQDSQYQETILGLRNSLADVFISPDIKGYIYSLIVFTRCHRLASLSPKSTRLPTMAIDYMHDFCKCLALWKNQSKLNQELFITPAYVKLAFRKIGYWLVDWEYNEMFAKDTQSSVLVDDDSNTLNNEIDYQKRLEISMLTGDWYGSDYFFVNEYLKSSKSKLDKKSSTGYTNKIIEDVISSVRPPL
ncbi:hypothetical protein MG3_04707 [Candida albicans P78048]|uniref:Uncharacterized protein n=1 Tax=Candida albicans P78048 TaxID=1094989 RepID=A0AB34PMV7_CANAX|nr:hypothetical protein MG3_04707 [Candida albicans P78048]